MLKKTVLLCVGGFFIFTLSGCEKQEKSQKVIQLEILFKVKAHI